MKFKEFVRNFLSKRIINFRELSGEKRIIILYRYISLLLTSILYIIDEPHSPLILKLIVILSLLVAAIMVNELYLKFHNSIHTIKTLVLVETFGIGLLLFPTGGLESPFIWYALNPVLVAAIYSTAIFCYLNLVFYISFASLISFLFFNENHDSFIMLLYKNSYMFLVFVLITIAVQLLSNQTRKLDEQADDLKEQRKTLSDMNRELKAINEQYKVSMEHIMSLYQVVEAFNSQDNLLNLPRIIAEYAVKLTRCRRAFFLSSTAGDSSKVFMTSYPETHDELEGIVTKLWDDIKLKNTPLSIRIGKDDFLITGIKSSSKYFGLMGIQLNNSNMGLLCEQYEKELNFLSELSSVIFERYRLQEVSDQLIVAEEQNRIANEMHDSVSQRMFSIVCAIHAVMQKIDKISREELHSQLNLIRDSANTAMQELRTTIYHLSAKKRGEKNLYDCIKSYLSDLEALNKIKIDFNSSGDEELIPPPVKRIIYRIISEAAGNAIRHGQCSRLDISLSISTELIKLMIIDNGSGFSMENVNNRGLGIDNMNNLVRSYFGSIDIKSEIGKGTEIDILIPNGLIYEISQGGIA